MRIRLDGAEWWDVREFVREKEADAESNWHVKKGATALSDSQIRKYMEKADRIVQAEGSRDRGRLIRRHLAQRRNLYAKATVAGDIRTALACLRDEAEMLGLYPQAKAKSEATSVTVSVIGGIDLAAVIGQRPGLHERASLN